MDPERAMRMALGKAAQASGRVFPNPAVGAVVFRGGEVLARGRTRPPGGPHAEVVALKGALRRCGARRVRGASLAVTLEPCGSTGRTPPCTDAIVQAGIRRVYVGVRDPHPEVRGRGLRRLRRAGISVCLGVLAEECRTQHQGFISVHERGRPYLTLKLASTLDGRIATARGESRWITSPESRTLVHRLRAASDAVMIGSGTLLADAPELSARRGKSVVHRPVRVVFDTRLRTSADPRLARSARRGATWIVTGRQPPRAQREALEAQGVRILAVPRQGPTLHPRRALERLAREGLTTVLCEGGGVLAAGLLREGLVDELHWFVAPTLLGSDARPALGDLRIARLADAVRLLGLRVQRLGPDVHLWGRPAPVRA